jgi:hypothetical protein
MIGQLCHFNRDERIGSLPCSAEQMLHDILIGLCYIERSGKEKAREEKKEDDNGLFHE